MRPARWPVSPLRSLRGRTAAALLFATEPGGVTPATRPQPPAPLAAFPIQNPQHHLLGSGRNAWRGSVAEGFMSAVKVRSEVRDTENNMET